MPPRPTTRGAQYPSPAISRPTFRRQKVQGWRALMSRCFCRGVVIVDRSHPVEIGSAWIEDGRLLEHASLIRPHPTWAPDWPAESAAVHGIDRGALDDAEPTENVARRFAVLLAGRTIVSDAPEFDGPWLGRVLSLLPDPSSVRLVDIDAFLHLALSREGQRAAYASLAGSPTPHRGAATRRGSRMPGLRDCVLNATGAPKDCAQPQRPHAPGRPAGSTAMLPASLDGRPDRHALQEIAMDKTLLSTDPLVPPRRRSRPRVVFAGSAQTRKSATRCRPLPGRAGSHPPDLPPRQAAINSSPMPSSTICANMHCTRRAGRRERDAGWL